MDLGERVDLREYLRPIRERWWLILGIVVVVTVATYVVTDREARRYKSETALYVQSSDVSELVFGQAAVYTDPTRDLANQAALMTSVPVLKAVAKRLRVDGDPLALAGNVTVTPDGDADFLRIDTTASSAQEAADIANAFAQEYISVTAAQNQVQLREAQRLAERDLSGLTGANLRNARADARERISRLRLLQEFPATQAEQVRPAQAPARPFAPRVVRNAVFAGLLALLAGVLLALGLDRLDRRVKGIEDLERVFGLPLLAALPATRDPAPSLGGLPTLGAGHVEAFRTLRTNIQLVSLSRPIRTLLVTSGMPAEGKSTVARGLGLSFAETDKRVVVVDCDLRKPTLARMLGDTHAGHPGLTELLTGQASLSEALIEMDAGVVSGRQDTDGFEENGTGHRDATVHLITAGTPSANPSTVFLSERFEAVLDQLRSEFDLVVIDSPPLLPVADAVPLVRLVDGTLIVARDGVTSVDAAKRVLQAVARAKGREVVGLVANAFDEGGLVEGRKYGYGYGYGMSPGTATRAS